MKTGAAAELVNGVDLHYYTMPIWPDMDSATEFDDDLYYKTIGAAYFADELPTKHSDRVVMANLAQTVNVLQSIILTEGDALDYNDFTKPEEVSFAL